MRTSYILLFLLFTTLLTRAQGLPGYVLTLSGDTLRGTLVEQRHEQQLALYSSGSRTPQLFRAEQVRGYGLRGQPAVRVQVVQLATGSAAPYFVLPLQVGSAGLYSYANETGLLLLPPATDTLQELTATNWHVLCNRYLRGCATLDHTNSRILQLSFTERNVRQVLMAYNQCLDPAWKSAVNPERSVWRSGLGVQATSISSRYREDGRQQATGRGYQLGMEWIHVRANGVQTILSGSYSYLAEKTAVFHSTFSPATDRQQLTYHRLLDANVTAGRRFGRPNRPALFLGLGIGALYNFNTKKEIRERPAGTSTPLQTAEMYHERGGLVTYVGGTAGAIVPVGIHHEVRLAATYRHHVYVGLNVVGLQLAYDWFRK